MRTKAVDEDEKEPRKMRSSRSKRRHHTRRASSTESEYPPRKRSGKRTPADKKSKRSKVGSSSRRRRRSSSPSPSLSSSTSPSSVSRTCSTCSSSSSEQSVSPPPPRSRSRYVKKRKGRGRDRERRKARRSTSASSSTSSSSGSRSKSSKRWIKDGTKRDKNGKDYKKVTDSFDRDEEALVAAKKRRDYGTERHEKNVSLEKTENPPSKNADETEDVLTAAGGGSPVAEDLELILRQKALDNFRKFRAAAAMAGKTDNGATRKETLTDSPQTAGTKVNEARCASITPFHRQASSLVARNPTESPQSEDCGIGTSPRLRNSSAGMTHGAGSHSRILKDGDTGGPTQQVGSIMQRSPQDSRNSRSVMQRLVHTPGSASSITRRLGSSAGVSHVNAAPRIKSVVSIPAREELDGSSSSRPQRACENPTPVQSSDDVRCNPIDISTRTEGTNGDDRKTSELSASNGSILSPSDGKRQVTELRIEDTDSSQLQKKTFSRMHDGETVEASYTVYIPKKTPALARRKLQH